HQPLELAAQQLCEVVSRVGQRGGKALVPAFSLGRTQLAVHALRRGLQTGQIPNVPIFVDSPLAADISEVYRRHLDCLSAETARRLADDPDFLGGDGVQYVRSFEESMELSARRGPCVIVAASGMCEAGRILQHLK